MKKINFLLGLVLSLFMLSSCDKNDDEKDKHIPVFNNKKLLVYCSKNESGLYGHKYEYDSYGRPNYTYDSKGKIEEYKYNYNDLNFSISNEGFNGRLTTNGFIESRSFGSNYKSFFYDEKGHLISEIFSKGRENIKYTWVWVNDNIVTISEKHDSYDSNSNYEINFAFKYTNDAVPTPIENKAGIPFIFYSLDDLETTIVIKNFLGEATKYLPVMLVSVTGEYKIDWTLDEEGYPTKVNFNKSTLYFTWN